MGCGASTDKGRESQNSSAAVQAETFFPPLEQQQPSSQQKPLSVASNSTGNHPHTSTTKNVQSQAANTTSNSSPVAASKKFSKPASSPKKKAAYVPPAPIHLPTTTTTETTTNTTSSSKTTDPKKTQEKNNHKNIDTKTTGTKISSATTTSKPTTTTTNIQTIKSREETSSAAAPTTDSSATSPLHHPPSEQVVAHGNRNKKPSVSKTTPPPPPPTALPPPPPKIEPSLDTTIQSERSRASNSEENTLGEESLKADEILGGGDGGLDHSIRSHSSSNLGDYGELTLTEDFDQAAISAITGFTGADMAKNTAATTTTIVAFEYPEESPQPDSTSGKRFDELYRLKGVLGTGAFSTVREGFHRSSDIISYAVKCINRKKLSEEDEAALLDEVSILKEMRHQHIIRLFDFFTEPATYYLVMERMRGGELFDRIVAKAYYNEKEARDTCKILLEAVGYCHANHVAHRDLKPENLLLLSDIDDSQVKIADFGFAKKVYKKNSLTTQCGTPGYVAPEILEGVPYDERADMWSVGVILYILLGGYPPFIESTQRDLFRKIRKGDYEFHEEYWGTVSQEAKELISSLLTVSADDRLTADEALQNAWILGDDAALASKDLGGNLEKLRNFNGKRKFRAAVSTIIAVNKLNFMGKDFLTNLRAKEEGECEGS